MAISVAAVARLEHYLTVGGKHEHLAGLLEEAALFTLFLAAGGLVLVALFFAWRETALRCLHHAAVMLSFLAATLVIVLISGFSVHSWRASFIVPGASLGLSFLILLLAAGWHSTRSHDVPR